MKYYVLIIKFIFIVSATACSNMGQVDFCGSSKVAENIFQVKKESGFGYIYEL